jgi:hypothetical protein
MWILLRYNDMKILERGTPPGEQVFRVSCKTCKSKLEFTAGEAKHDTDRRGGNDEWWKVDCPVCKQLVYGYRNDIVVKDSND